MNLEISCPNCERLLDVEFDEIDNDFIGDLIVITDCPECGSKIKVSTAEAEVV